MKRVFSVFVFLVVFSISGHAQIIDDISLTATVNQSEVYSTDRNVVRNPSTGWEAGILGEKRLTNFLAISAGVKIARIRFGLNDFGVSHVTYLSLPSSLKATFPLGLYAKAGLRFDLRIGYNNAWIEGVGGEGFASASDKYETGWIAGMGKVFNLGGIKPWVEIVYSKDFDKFSGYERIIAMNKNTLKLTVGIPIARWQ